MVESSQHFSAGLPGNMSRQREPTWWRIKWFQGMMNDIKRRAPFYMSDWIDAWDYRVVPATVYVYATKYVRPRILYSHKTLYHLACWTAFHWISSVFHCGFEMVMELAHRNPAFYPPSLSLSICLQRLP